MHPVIRKVLWVTVVPVIRFVFDELERKGQRARQKRKEACRAEVNSIWNARLPPQRPTDEDSADAGIFTHVSTQQQSPFFMKLPLELRRIIYAYALGGEQLVIRVRGQEFQPRRYLYDWSSKVPFELSCPEARELLAPVRTCKMIYTEAVHFIYTSNTFLFTDFPAYVCFQRLCHERYFQMIRVLHLKWSWVQAREYFDVVDGHPPWDISTWNRVWYGIAQIKGLTFVRLDMIIHAPEVYDVYENLLFTTLKAIKPTKGMEVRVNWERPISPTTGATAGPWPFTVIKGRYLPMGYGGRSEITLSNAE